MWYFFNQNLIVFLTLVLSCISFVILLATILTYLIMCLLASIVQHKTIKLLASAIVVNVILSNDLNIYW